MVCNYQFINIVVVTSIILAINSSMSAMFPIIVTSRGINETESGFICFVTGILVMSSTFIFGYLNDKLTNSRSKLLKCNYLIQCIILVVFALY